MSEHRKLKQPVNRMLPGGEGVVAPAGEPIVSNGAKETKKAAHWSACPNCGASKLSTGATPTPVVVHSCRLAADAGHVISCRMRCRHCDHTFKAIKPD